MKRLFALAVGVGLGAAAAAIASRSVRRARERLPAKLVSQAARAAESLRTTIRSAIEEGRQVMRQAEQELSGLQQRMPVHTGG